MRALLVVFDSPARNLASRIPEIPEPTRVQTFITQASVKAFDMPVPMHRRLHRNATLRREGSKSLIPFIHGMAASSSWSHTRVPGVKTESISTTNSSS